MFVLSFLFTPFRAIYIHHSVAQANALKNYLHKYKDGINDTEEIDKDEKQILDHIGEFVQFTMVIRFNSVELQPPARDGNGPGPSYGHGLFDQACKMNHSCKPNCVWFTTQDGKSKEVRAISIIRKHEELTVDYNGNVLDATPQRRDDLFQAKGFLCECVRCAADHDDTRRFKCITQQTNSQCTGYHFLCQPTYSKAPSLLDCNCCGRRPTEDYVHKVMKEEMKLVREINELDSIADTDGIVSVKDRIKRLDPPHTYHSLAEKCYLLQGELYSALGEYKSSAEAFAKAIDCRIEILGTDYWSQATAFTCERLGDALKYVNIEEAEEAYRRTVRALELMRGGGHSDPYVKCAMKKLLTVQQSSVVISSDNLPREECLKGIADAPEGPPVTDFPCRLCGKPSIIPTSSRDALSYCCEFHKQMHHTAVRDRSIAF